MSSLEMKRTNLEIWEINFLKKHGYDPKKVFLKPNQPVEYFVGKCDFCDLELNITPPVLIPRIETEKIVDLSIEKINKKKKDVINIAEIGCGSLAISLALAKKIKKQKNKYKIIAGDISKKAFFLSKKNLQKYSTFNIEIILSNLMNNFPKKKFDLIVANLPYIPSHRLKKLNKSVSDYEAISALNGGENGLSLINELLEQIPQFLNKNGYFILEIDETHKIENFKNFFHIYKLKIEKDCFNKNRFLVGKLIS